MSSTLVIGLGLAIIASAAFNASYLLQFKGADSAPAVSLRRPWRTVKGLFASRVWVLGAVLGFAGIGLHVAALDHAPLSLVQTFITGGLVLAVPMATRGLGHTLARGEKLGVGLMSISLIVLSLGIGAPSRAQFADVGLIVFLSCAGVAAAALMLMPLGHRRGPVLGLASGLLYAAGDLVIKVLVGEGASVFGVLLSPLLLAAVVLNLAAFFAFQRALQLGRALPVIALMTCGTTVVSILGGLVVLGDPLGDGAPMTVAHVAAFVVVVLAAWKLAPTQAVINTARPATTSHA
jgi:hypothetical protein